MSRSVVVYDGVQRLPEHGEADEVLRRLRTFRYGLRAERLQQASVEFDVDPLQPPALGAQRAP